MTDDFFTTLAGRTLGVVPVARPANTAVAVPEMTLPEVGDATVWPFVPAAPPASEGRGALSPLSAEAERGEEEQGGTGSASAPLAQGAREQREAHVFHPQQEPRTAPHVPRAPEGAQKVPYHGRSSFLLAAAAPDERTLSGLPSLVTPLPQGLGRTPPSPGETLTDTVPSPLPSPDSRVESRQAPPSPGRAGAPAPLAGAGRDGGECDGLSSPRRVAPATPALSLAGEGGGDALTPGATGALTEPEAAHGAGVPQPQPPSQAAALVAPDRRVAPPESLPHRSTDAPAPDLPPHVPTRTPVALEREGPVPAAPAEPIIRVTIGRIDVHAVAPPAPVKPTPKPIRRGPRLSLDNYLQQRAESRR